MDTVYNTDALGSWAEMYERLPLLDFARTLPVREALEDARYFVSDEDLVTGEAMLLAGDEYVRPDSLSFWRYENERLTNPLGAGEFAAFFDTPGGSYDPLCGREFMALAVCILLSPRTEWMGDGYSFSGSRNTVGSYDFKPMVYAWLRTALGIARPGLRDEHTKLYESAHRRRDKAAKDALENSPLSATALRRALSNTLSRWMAARTCRKGEEFVSAVRECAPYLKDLQEKDALNAWLEDPVNVRTVLGSFVKTYETACGKRPRDATFSKNMRDYQIPLIWAHLLPAFDRLGLLELDGITWPTGAEGLRIGERASISFLETGDETGSASGEVSYIREDELDELLEKLYAQMVYTEAEYTINGRIVSPDVYRGLMDAYAEIEPIVKAAAGRCPAIASINDFFDKFGLIFDTYRELTPQP